MIAARQCYSSAAAGLTASDAAGSQLFNTYGPRSNDNLLLRYMFVVGDNPDDVYILDDLPQRLRSQQVWMACHADLPAQACMPGALQSWSCGIMRRSG
jgi:hypothetical protein